MSSTSLHARKKSAKKGSKMFSSLSSEIEQNYVLSNSALPMSSYNRGLLYRCRASDEFHKLPICLRVAFLNSAYQ